jgi:hypothetical protein
MGRREAQLVEVVVVLAELYDARPRVQVVYKAVHRRSERWAGSGTVLERFYYCTADREEYTIRPTERF